MKKKALPVTMFVSLLLTLIISLFVSILRNPVFYGDSRIFKGYYTVLIKLKSSDQAGIKEILKDNLFKKAISRYSALVSFNDYTGGERITLNKIKKRLDPLDPRYDSYLKRLNSYFYAKSGGIHWQIVYVPSARNPISMYMALNTFFNPVHVKWKLAGFSLSSGVINLVLSVLFMYLILIYVDFKNKIVKAFLAFGFIPWIMNILPGGLGDIILFFPVFYSWSIILKNIESLMLNSYRFNWDNKDKNDLPFYVVRFLAAGIVPSLFLLVTGSDSALVIRTLTAVVYEMILTAILIRALFLRIKYVEYNIFEPVPILKSFHRWRDLWNLHLSLKKIKIILLTSLVIFTPIVFTVVNSINSTALPQPVKVKNIGKKFSWQNLEMLSRNASGDEFPNISGYIIHRAFQEGFPFGMKYRFPGENENLYVKEYTYNKVTGRVMESLRRVKRYDSTWLKSVFLSIPETSIAGMLFRQKEPVGIEDITTIQRAFILTPLWGVFLVVFVFFFFLRPWKFNFTGESTYDFKRLYEET